MALFGKPNPAKLQSQVEKVEREIARESARLAKRGPLGLNAEGRKSVTEHIASLETELKGLKRQLDLATYGPNAGRTI